MEFKLKLANSTDSNLERIFVFGNDILASINDRIQSNFGFSQSQYVLLSKNGIKLNSKSVLNEGDVIQLSPLILGGKGGFGSLLRSFGKQITKSTNKEACRDLTGRRIRHVNNEKRLKEFLSKQSEIAKKKEEEKKIKLEQKKKKREKLESSHHLFVDPKYDEQKLKITEDLEHAMSSAICSKKLNSSDKPGSENEAKSGDGNSSSNGEDSEKITKKSETKDNEKFRSWLGIDDVDVSSSEDEEEPAKKIKLN
ncbi:SDE2-like protein [Brachionus plicatilis]|uniref:SDE2-like protein n=1 Tax=Brachionus plicatilis TaxID=10195 RepID=A0A3M7SM75_BRAPC|nr:SDE2-like protein [Brachionus plicatilis]